MAGFFGLFNYEKEGPGIAKDAPPKKSFIVFLEMFKRNFWKFIPVSIISVLISIPVITNGLACVGITNVVRNTARDKHSFGMSDYFETVKKNWKQALAAGIINTVIVALTVFSARFYLDQYKASGSYLHLTGFSIMMSLLIIFNFAQYYMWTMMITFKLKLKDIYKNSFKIAIANLWRNLLVGILMLLTYALYYAVVYFLGQFVITWVFVGFFILCTLPTYRFLMIQFVAFPAIKKYMIDPYYEEHPDDDIEQRKNLGLLD